MVFDHTDGLANSGEGVFGDEAVLGFAKLETDGGLVVLGFDLGINGGEIEVELTGVFRLEGHSLEFHHHIALQAGVIQK